MPRSNRINLCDWPAVSPDAGISRPAGVKPDRIARADGRGEVATVTIGAVRDLRLDFFRGIALFLIFIDHIPGNVLSHFTVQSLGFSDAAEIFIFVSGYTAALVYGRALLKRGVLICDGEDISPCGAALRCTHLRD